MSLRELARWCTPCLLVMAGVVLASCEETALVTNTAKQISQPSKTAGPQGQPVYKVGKPYQVEGVWYYPGVDYNYAETGIASWYGPDFHGKLTANGELYDMNEVTGAHKTLPLPSIVRVTNLENGRSLMVRINDRGPFVNGRIVDLSRRAAQLLGYEQAGTAKVRVEVVDDQSRQLATSMPRDPNEAEPAPSVVAAPRAPVVAQELPPPGSPPPLKAPPAPSTPAANAAAPKLTAPTKAAANVAAADPPAGQAASVNPKLIAPPPPVVTQVAAGPTNMYVQAGAFTQFDNANRLRATLSPMGQTNISQVQVDGQQLFRVRVGPIGDVNAADRMLDRIIKAGYKDARLIVAE